MNSVCLIGRLVKDPESRTTTKGSISLPFRIAVDRNDKDRNTDFIDCQEWNTTAKFICQYFHKGDPITIIGKLQTRVWEKEDGSEQKITEVLVNECGFVPITSGNKKSGNEIKDSDDGIQF